MADSTSDSEIRDVSDTALWVATYRAIETERPDALFRDPFAARLAGKKGRAIARHMPGGRYTKWAVVIRTCIIDTFIRNEIARGVDTVVNLGAGLDTRPYRMDLPKTLRWVEVDYPHMIDLKNRELGADQPRCRLERVKLDLTDHGARREFFSGLGAGSRGVLVLTEGVVPYLTNEDVGLLADDLRAQPAFQGWILDYWSPEVAGFLKKGWRSRGRKNAPLRFFPPDWFAFFSEHGWAVREMRYQGEESLKLGRPIPMPRWATLLRFLIPKKRLEKIQKMMGYALLGPGPKSGSVTVP